DETLRRRYGPCRAVDCGGAIADVHRDACSFKEARLDQRKIVRVHAVEVRAQGDAIVSWPRLLAERGDPIRAWPTFGDQEREQSMPHHTVADDDEVLTAVSHP